MARSDERAAVPDSHVYVKIHGIYTFSLGAVREALAAQGLHVVLDADDAVLKAIAAIPSDDIELALDLRDGMSGSERRMWKAELARREEKG